MFSKGFKDFVLNLKQRPQKQLRTLRLLWFSKITVASIVLILKKNLKNYERFDCSDSQKYRVRARLSNLWFDYQKSKPFSTNNRMVSGAYRGTKLHHRAPESQRGTVHSVPSKTVGIIGQYVFDNFPKKQKYKNFQKISNFPVISLAIVLSECRP